MPPLPISPSSSSRLASGLLVQEARRRARAAPLSSSSRFGTVGVDGAHVGSFPTPLARCESPLDLFGAHALQRDGLVPQRPETTDRPAPSEGYPQAKSLGLAPAATVDLRPPFGGHTGGDPVTASSGERLTRSGVLSSSREVGRRLGRCSSCARAAHGLELRRLGRRRPAAAGRPGTPGCPGASASAPRGSAAAAAGVAGSSFRVSSTIPSAARSSVSTRRTSANSRSRSLWAPRVTDRAS